MNFYETLGVDKNASDEDIKKAYRKLASQHHPDKGGDAEKFKEIQKAYETLSNKERRQKYDRPREEHTYHSLDEILRAHQRHFQEAMNQLPPEISIDVTFKQAFEGVEFNFNLRGRQDSVKLPPGIPHGARAQYISKNEQKVVVTVNILQVNHNVKHLQSCKQILNGAGAPSGNIDSGDVLTSINLDAIDLILGAWTEVEDILGKRLTVRVPAGHNPLHRLKVKGQGYLNWSLKHDRADDRGDMYVLVKPVFNAPAKIDPAKAEALYKLTRKSE